MPLYEGLVKTDTPIGPAPNCSAVIPAKPASRARAGIQEHLIPCPHVGMRMRGLRCNDNIWGTHLFAERLTRNTGVCFILPIKISLAKYRITHLSPG